MKEDSKATAKNVLKLLALGGIVTASILAPGLPITLHYISKKWKKYKQRELSYIIRRFIKQDIISVKEEEGQQIIVITEKGRKKLLKYDFENLEVKAKKRDGFFRAIIFDIPENQKSNREVFRKKLTELGFKRLQDSVYISAFPCKDEIDFLCHYLNISKFVTVILVKRIERGEELIFKKAKTF